MKNLIVPFTLLAITACAPQTEEKIVYRSGVAVEPSNQDKVDAIVTDENAHRFKNGQTLLSEGLTCKLYTISGGHTLLAGPSQITGKVLVATFAYKGEFNQPNTSVSAGLNIIPEGIRSSYTNMYMLSCEGQLIVTESNYYEFSVNSDDASLLYVGGSLVSENDGAHASVIKSGTKYLKKGIHNFKLQYAQTAGGNQALILTSGGALVDKMYFYR